MHIVEVGRGKPVVVIHGLPGTTSYFQPLTDALSPTRRVLLSELPGYGRSPPEPSPYSMARVTQQLEDDLLARGADTVDVVGSSLGGYRALLLALSGRVKIDRLYLLGAFADLAPQHREAFRQLTQLLASLPNLEAPALRRQLALGLVAPAWAAAHPERIPELEAWLDATTAQAMANELGAAPELESLVPRLGELRVRTTIRVGDADAATPVAYSRQLAEGIAGSTLEIVVGCGHALLLEDPVRTVESIVSALR